MYQKYFSKLHPTHTIWRSEWHFVTSCYLSSLSFASFAHDGPSPSISHVLYLLQWVIIISRVNNYGQYISYDNYQWFLDLNGKDPELMKERVEKAMKDNVSFILVCACIIKKIWKNVLTTCDVGLNRTFCCTSLTNIKYFTCTLPVVNRTPQDRKSVV